MAIAGSSEAVLIDAALVRRLVADQFPEWAQLPVSPVELSGWDNRTFHLVPDMTVRLPSAAHYAAAVEKEQSRSAIEALRDRIDADVATAVWNAALRVPISATLVWYHGDVAAGNRLVREGALSAVIDFGGLAVGDPACVRRLPGRFSRLPAGRCFDLFLLLMMPCGAEDAAEQVLNEYRDNG